MTHRDAIQPHGGALVSRWVEGSDRHTMLERAQAMPRVVLSERAQGDLDLIAVGAYSPLRGFLGHADYRNVVDNMHLVNGTLWPVPVCLSVDRALAEGLKDGEQIALVDARDRTLAVMELAERFAPDKALEAQKVYRTTDPAHPGVAELMASGEVCLAGEVHVLEGRESIALPEHRRDPAQTRASFRERGWRSVVAFHTRTPMDRAQEYLTKCALEMVDGLLIHPQLERSGGAGVAPDVCMRCYEVLIASHYPKERVLLSVYPAAARHAGPREAVLDAIARKNYGCTHFIVGRDHASVGAFYGGVDAQKIFDEISPAELGITPLKLDNAFFSTVTGQMATAKTAPGGAETQLSLSHRELGEWLRSGQPLPAELVRPEVAQILQEALRTEQA